MITENKSRNRIITEYEMTSGDKFCFGTGYMLTSKRFYWSPDDKDTQNAHLMIVGGSGSGKTRLVKKIIEYLHKRDKQVYVIDFHGDMETTNETKFTFSLRNSDYGLNPFEFIDDLKNGGPNAHVNLLVEIFRKNFIPNMGPVQKTALKQLLTDTYKYVGIYDELEDTWQKDIPTIDDLYTLYFKIKERIEKYGFEEILKIFKKLSKEKENLIECENSGEDSDKIVKRIDKLFNKLSNDINLYKEYVLYNKNQDIFMPSIKNVDIDFYHDPAIFKAFISLMPYIKDLYESSVFNDKKPPAIKGVVRYDISGLSNNAKPLEAMFFSDIMVQKIFRAYKNRGDYRDITNKNPKKRDTKADSFIVIDESKLVLPNGKEKESPYNILNRVVTEARKYGLGLIIVSQRAEHFPQEMISSIYTKVVLKINENDIPSAHKLLGVRDRNLFEHLKTDGVALVGVSGGKFNSVSLPWAAKNGS